MKARTLLLMAGLALAVTTNAFSQNEGNETFGGAGYFGFRINNYNLSGINSSLQSNNIPTLNEAFFGYGGGGLAYIGRLVIGGEGYGFQTPEKNNGAYRSNFSGGIGFFDVGYVVLNNRRCLLYPIVGFGGGTYTINIYDPANTDFTTLLSNPRRGTQLRTEQFILDLGLQTNLFIFNTKFFSVGLKGGYQLAPVKTNWNDANGTLANGPEFDANALYGQINLTFGGFSN
jgi:hypothetical protein